MSATASKKRGSGNRRFYRLKAGSHSQFETTQQDGAVVTRVVKTINSNDPKNNWLESQENLAAQEPTRWEEINPPPEALGEEGEVDVRMLEPPPPGPPTDEDRARAAAIVNRGTQSLEMRKAQLEKELELLEEAEKEAKAGGKKSGKAKGNDPGLGDWEAATEHKRTLMGASDSADEALKEFEERQREVSKGGVVTAPGQVPSGQVLPKEGAEEPKKGGKK